MDHQLFIVWEKGRHREAQILAALSEAFEIKGVVNVVWSSDLLASNFHRLYGSKITPRMSKPRQVGQGPLLAIVVRDTTPRFEFRVPVSGGYKRANAEVFDLKDKFRVWTGGNRVHASVDAKEFNHDMALLFGPGFRRRFRLDGDETWDGRIDEHHEDLVGARGWRDLREFFATINGWADYVVLRNWDGLDRSAALDSGSDIDILCSDQKALASAANGTPTGSFACRPAFNVLVGGDVKKFDFRFVGDGYLDRQWQEHILSNRELHRQAYFVPNAEDRFFSLLCHSAFHKRRFPTKHVKTLTCLAEALGVQSISEHFQDDALPECSWFNDRGLLTYVMSQFLIGRRYKFSLPDDFTITLRLSLIRQLDRRVRPAWRSYQLLKPLRRARSKLEPLAKRLEYRLHATREARRAAAASDRHDETEQTRAFDGVVASGRGRANYQVAGAARKIKALMGWEPVPGTLNVTLSQPVLFKRDRAVLSVNGRLSFWSAVLGGHPCLVYRWSTCPLHVAEIVADRHFRTQDGLEDGQRVSLEVCAGTVDSLPMLRRLAWGMLWWHRESMFYSSATYWKVTRKLPLIGKMGFQKV